MFGRQGNELWYGEAHSCGVLAVLRRSLCPTPSVYSSPGSLPLSGKQLTNARVLAHSCTRKASHSTVHSSPSWAVYWQHRLLSPTKAYFSQILLFLSLRILPKDAMRPLCLVTMHLGLGWVICLGYKTVGL